MGKTGARWWMMVLLVLATVLPVAAAMQVEGTQNVRLPKAALDVAATADGAKLFVLLKGGEVQVLSPAGQVIDQLNVAAEVEQLTVSPEGDRLYLTVGQELRIVDLASKFELPVHNSPVKGPANAPVTITVFSDFQCPYCSRLVPILDEVMAKNPDKVRVVFKQFPLRMHNMAEPAALASLAANEQGKFWPLHDLLFANSNQLGEDKIRSLAQQAGLDMARFDRDRNAPRLREEIKRDMTLGQQAGVQGTPTLYLNGKLLRVRTPQEMQALIDREATRVKAGK